MMDGKRRSGKHGQREGHGYIWNIDKECSGGKVSFFNRDLDSDILKTFKGLCDMNEEEYLIK